MVIGIDGNEGNTSQKVGVSVYTTNLLYYFNKWANQNTQFKVYLKEKPSFNLPKENRYFKYKIVPGKFLWSQVFLPLNLYQERSIDVFFSPAHYLPRFCPVPQIVTIHDLSYLYYPENFLKKDLYQLKNWTKYSILKAKKIIAVSNSTKNDILKNYHLPEKKIIVIYNGYEKIKGKKSTLKIRKNNKPYLLYVGTIQPRKNISFLLSAFAKIKTKYPQLELILAGKKGWLYEEIFKKVIDLGLEKEVFFTDYITDYQLIFLYQNALCLIMPSLYEGFGIPILEAMSLGCPVISSFVSSLPEIGGDACLYFDPKDENDLLDKLKILMENKTLRKELIEKGKKRVRLFSWEKSAQETLTVIKNIALKTNDNKNNQ
ncbi:MAG: glycosyltransferase family 4 protein [Patescibacteria group bacterium]|nr:glycosyltransferase family 4 protein [Patescibacteria group bacterium]